MLRSRFVTLGGERLGGKEADGLSDCWLEEPTVRGVGSAVGWENLAVAEEGTKSPKSSVNWMLIQRHEERVLVFETDIVTPQAPSMVSGVESIGDGKDTPN